jgi:hypothetical protein
MGFKEVVNGIPVEIDLDSNKAHITFRNGKTIERELVRVVSDEPQFTIRDWPTVLQEAEKNN